MSSLSKQETPPQSRTAELKALLILTVIILPGLTVMFISAYGFVVWFSQMLLGPPGHG